MVFNQNEVLRIIDAKDPKELTRVALDFLRRRATPVALVCGPITTGSHRTPEENRRRMAEVISILRRKKITVFDQYIFLRQIEKMRGTPLYHDRTYLREVFHVPLLRSGWISTIYMIFEWRKSVGAKWYHDCAKELGIEIRILVPKRDTEAAVA